MTTVDVFTIGFTKTTAERFFARLVGAGVRRVLDVRLNNTGQLSGFAKQPDLAFFCDRIGGMEYIHEPVLAPEPDMLKAYKRDRGMDWPAYERHFMALLSSRRVEERLDPVLFDGACLLCSEATSHRCHRRLVCEYLNERWGDRLKVRHL